MNKKEMKNRISMALKDPILQQGFEIICKENTELRKVAEFQQYSNMSRHFFNKKLIKAKEIIKDYMIVATNITVCSVPEENRCIDVLELNKQAKQFLSEVEK